MDNWSTLCTQPVSKRTVSGLSAFDTVLAEVVPCTPYVILFCESRNFSDGRLPDSGVSFTFKLFGNSSASTGTCMTTVLQV